MPRFFAPLRRALPGQRVRLRVFRALTLTVLLFAPMHPATARAAADPTGVPSSALAPAEVVTGFDLAVKGSLPAVLALPTAVPTGEAAMADAGKRSRRATPGAGLVVTQALNAWVDLPGMSQGQMYLGTYDGRDAALTRIGDHLDISLEVADGVEVIGFTAGNPDIFHDTVRHAAPRPDNAAHAPPKLPSLARTPRAIEDPLAYSPAFYVFIHDDVRALPRPVHAVFGALWFADLASRVFPAEKMRLTYFLGIPGVTDMPYGYPEALENWSNTVAAWSAMKGLAHGKTYKHKFMLLTRERPMPGAFGVAFEGGAEGMASTAGRATILAHEFGHLWDATHADAQRAYQSWWWCTTHMFPGPSDALSDCNRYSAQNQRNMRSYLHHGPDPESLAARRTAIAD